MRDPEIRAALVAQLRRAHQDLAENRIWPEMSVGLGASRVDVGLVNGRITGYEIKSDRDNLDRLPSQVTHYSRCLDRAVLVTTAKQQKVADRMVPAWWGLVVAAPGADGKPRLRTARTARANPELDPFYIAQLLWREEAYAELECRGLHAGLAKATRWVLWDRLAELPLRSLRDAVRARLKARPAS